MVAKHCGNCGHNKNYTSVTDFICVDKDGALTNGGEDAAEFTTTVKVCGQWTSPIYTIDPDKEKAAAAVQDIPLIRPDAQPVPSDFLSDVNVNCHYSPDRDTAKQAVKRRFGPVLDEKPVSARTQISTPRLNDLLDVFNTTTCNGCPFEAHNPDTHEPLCLAGDLDDCVPVLLRWLRGEKRGGGA